MVRKKRKQARRSKPKELTKKVRTYSESHAQTLLSEERTLLSKERTILQEITVFLTLIALGFGIMKIFEANWALASVGSLFVVLGIALVFASLYSYHQYNAKVKKLERENQLEDVED